LEEGGVERRKLATLRPGQGEGPGLIREHGKRTRGREGELSEKKKGGLVTTRIGLKKDHQNLGEKSNQGKNKDFKRRRVSKKSPRELRYLGKKQRQKNDWRKVVSLRNWRSGWGVGGKRGAQQERSGYLNKRSLGT